MKWTFALALGSLAVVGGCKKGSTTGGGGGGGGGGWLVGASGLMQHFKVDGSLAGYNQRDQHDLLGIACEDADTAFVVGVGGTFLRTLDGGQTWDPVDLGTSAALRAVATGTDVVFVAGDGVLERSDDGGDTWTQAPGAALQWRSVATDAESDVALGLASDGTVWRWSDDGLAQVTALAGAESVTLSPDGRTAAVVGAHGALLESVDGGLSWSSIATGTSLDLHAVWANGSSVLAVGEAGAIVRVSDSGVDLSTPGEHTLRAVHLDGVRGMAAGESGEILSTSDGGATWDVSDTHVDGTVFALDLVDAEDHL